MSLTQITSHGIADGAIVNADLHTNAALALSKLNTSGTASSSTFLRGDGAWTAIDLSNLSASNLTSGTVPDARFPSTLPALNGSALTALNASNLASGTVGTARLGSGTASSSTFLRGDGSWQTMSADGGNAATLDSIDSSQFLRSDTADSFTGTTLTLNSTTTRKIDLTGADNPYIYFLEGSTGKAYIQWHSDGNFYLYNQEVSRGFRVGSQPQFYDGSNYVNVWHASNDGSGSGLDADTVDGFGTSQSGGANYVAVMASNGYLYVNNWISVGNSTGLYAPGGSHLYNGGASTWQSWINQAAHASACGIGMRTNDGTIRGWTYADTTHVGLLNGGGSWLLKCPVGNVDNPLTGSGYTLWHSNNDGSGSGLDADTCDGQHLGTSVDVTHAAITATDWLRTNSNGEGLYNSQSDAHFYSAGNSYWHLNGNSGDITHGALILYDRYNSSHGDSTGRKGYLYWDSSGFGLLSNNGSWAYRHNNTHADIYGTIRRDASHTIWDSGNDGSGSGLDADTCDGQHLGTSANVTHAQIHASNWFRNDSAAEGLYNTPTNSHFYSAGNNYWHLNPSSNNVSNGGLILYDRFNGTQGNSTGRKGYLYWDTSYFGLLHSGGGWAVRTTSSATTLYGTVTREGSTIWHAGNDGSGSGLDADTVDGVQLDGLVQKSHNSNYLLRFGSGTNTGHTRSSNAYAIFQEGGAWSTPYPDLCINYHTGIKIGCGSQSYGGLRFTPDYNSETILMSINNGTESYGNGNVRVNTALYCDNRFRNIDSGEGLYNVSTGQHFYSDHDDIWNMGGGEGGNFVRFRDVSGGTIRGYVGVNNSSSCGFLDYEGNWSFSTGKFTNYSYRDLACSPDGNHDLGYGNRRWDNVYATNGTIQTSDRNEKENIVATDLGLDFVNKLNPVSFKRKGKTRTHYGFIAQDIEQILTDIGKTTTQFAPLIKSDISEAKDGSEYRYGLRYEQLLAPVVKAIQELAVKVAALESA